ncbi:Gx transporter family protein, partial [Phocaeicola coprophilus]|uniref:Gx transporter family protein n=1 Tax=Phocaeicola coprophilus TaxID=387090 RepID=UPI00402A170D
SVVGVSIIGSLFHSIGQVLVGVLFLNNYNVMYYLPYLLIFSIPTGIVIGIITKNKK